MAQGKGGAQPGHFAPANVGVRARATGEPCTGEREGERIKSRVSRSTVARPISPSDQTERVAQLEPLEPTSLQPP